MIYLPKSSETKDSSKEKVNHMTYTLTRQKRKSIGIYIKDGTVEVRAPLNLVQDEIDRFVKSKGKWIGEKIAATQKQSAKKREFTVDYGSSLLWRGTQYPILGDSNSKRIWRDEEGFHFPLNLDKDELKYNVIRLYKICAKNHLAHRVEYFSKIMGDIPNSVKVTDAQKRWGSCSKLTPPKACCPVYNLNFSWRLCMAQDDVIDGVVVHELAHIKEMNHSPAFYAVVRSVLPDYDLRREKLRELSARLGGEDWEI